MYSRARPITKQQMAKLMQLEVDGLAKDTVAAAHKRAALGGASHSAEIEYAMGNLATNLVYDWQPEDYRVSQIMQGYFANFIKTGNPNGIGLPKWPAITKGKPAEVMQIDVSTRVETEKNREGYLYFKSTLKK
jgi:para-nitrobenzyl esterase